MDFFRKYQRVILYTAGIFALVTFSISAPVMGFFEGVFREPVAMPTMEIGGRTVEVTPEDHAVASQLTLRDRSDAAVMMPPVVSADDEQDRRQIYAALRRLAIESGFEISEDDAERVIEGASARFDQTPAELAQQAGAASLADYRKILGEALRISTFVRLQALAADASDASLVQEMLEDAELVTLQVATLDEEKLQEQLETTEVDDQQLQEWIDSLEESERVAQGYTIPGKYRVEFAYLDLAQFDPAAFAEELGEVEFSEEEIEQFYAMNRATLFMKPKEAPKDPPKDGEEKDGDDQGDKGDKGEDGNEDGEQKPAEQENVQEEGGQEGQSDEEHSPDPQAEQAEQDDQDADAEQEPYLPLDDELKADIRKRLQAEAVMRALWDEITTRFDQAVAEKWQAVEAAKTAVEEQQAARDAAAERGSAADATQEEKDALAAAEAALEEKQAALKVAEEALQAERDEFNLVTAFESVGEGRPGLGVVDSGEELMTVAQLAELEPMAPWSGNVGMLAPERPLSTQVQRSKDAVFQMRLREVVRNPQKPFEDIREKARADYYQKRAEELADERAETFETKLKELAKAKVADKVTELEAKRDEQVEEKLTEWRQGVQQKLDEARQQLAQLDGEDPNNRAYRAWKTRVEQLEEQLANEAEKREEILAEVQEATDAKIEELAQENYASVLAEAAQAGEFELAEYGPFPRDLSARGGPRERFPKPVQYLFWFGSIEDLDEGEATDLLEDATGRARHLAVVKEVEPATVADLTRKQLLQARRYAGSMRRVEAVLQSFTLDALRARYGWQEPGTAVIESDPPGN